MGSNKQSEHSWDGHNAHWRVAIFKNVTRNNNGGLTAEEGMAFRWVTPLSSSSNRYNIDTKLDLDVGYLLFALVIVGFRVVFNANLFGSVKTDPGAFLKLLCLNATGVLCLFDSIKTCLTVNPTVMSPKIFICKTLFSVLSCYLSWVTIFLMSAALPTNNANTNNDKLLLL